LPRIGQCSALSRSFLPGQSLRSGGIWQQSRSTDRQDQPDRSVHASRGTPVTDPVIRAGNGDKQAWDALVERYAPLIWSICRQHRSDDADVGQSV